MNDSFKFPQSFRLLKILTVCLVVALTACEKEDPQKFIQEGRTLFNKGDMESARVQFQNALQIQPKFADAYYGLAFIDEKKQDWKSMFGNLLETTAIDPNHLEAQVKLGQIYMLSGQLDKAKEQANIALKLNPENINALIFQGSLKSREGNNAEALQIAERVLAKDSSNVDAIGLQASILSSDKRFDEALATLNRGIDAHPDDVGIRLLRIRLQTERKNYDEVIRDFEEMIAKNPENNAFRFALVDFLTNIEKSEQAEKVLRDAIAKVPGDIDLKLKLADYIERRDAGQTEVLLKEYIAANPTELRLKSRLARFYAGSNRIPEEQVILNEVIAADASSKDGLAAKVRLAQISSMQNDQATAGRLADEVIAVDAGNSDALLLRAFIRLDKKDTDGAVSDLRIVLRDQPNSDRAMVMMAQAYLLKGEYEVAESNWRKALEISPGNLSALAPLTSQLLNRGDAARALELLDKAVKVSPANPALLELLVQARAAKKDWAGAEAAVGELKKLPQGQIVAQLWSGLLAAQRGHNDEAINYFKEVLVKKPDTTKVLGAITNAYEAAGRRKELISYMKTFIQTNPNSLAAYSVLASAYGQEKQWNEAEKVLREAILKAPADLNLKFQLVNIVERHDVSQAEKQLNEFIAASPKEVLLKVRLAGLYSEHKRYSDAAKVMKDIVLADPTGKEGLAARIQLAQLALVQKDVSTANSLIEEVLKIDPNHFEALMIRADLRLKNKEYDGAIIDLQKITQNRSNSTRPMTMLAQAYLLKGDSEGAETQWQKMLDNNPANIEALGQLITQLRKRGDEARIEALLIKAQKANPANSQILEYMVHVKATKKDWAGAQAVVEEIKKLPQGTLTAQMLSGMLAESQGRYPEAIKFYKEVLSAKPNSELALAAVTRSHYAERRPDELIAYLKTLSQKHSDSIAVYNALGLAYSSEKQWDDAYMTLQEALKRNPKSLPAYRILGGVLTQQGKTKEVEALYRKGLAELPDNPVLMMELAMFYERTKDFAAAIASYNDIISKYPGNDEAVNNLADLLVNSGADQAGLKQALTLAERFKNSPNPYFQDTYGWVLFKSGEVDKALDVLKKAVSSAPDNATMRYHLGEVYHAAGANSASKVELEKALSLAQQQGNFEGIDRAKELLKQVGGSAGN